MRGFTTKISILRGREILDEFDSRIDWSDPEEIEVEPLVSLQPATSSEGPVERPQVVTWWTLVTRPGHDLPLRSTDRVRVAGSGMALSVVGDVQRWPHPIVPGAVHHVEAQLQVVSG